MATALPDWHDPVSSLGELLAHAGRRLQQARQLDPHGGFEPPVLEFTSKAQIYALLATLVLGLATVITVLFTRGPVFLALLGCTLVLGLYVYFVTRAANRYVARWRQEGVVVAAALVMANGRLFRPGNDMLPGVVVFSFDERLGRDADALAALGARLFALKAGPLEAVPATARDLARQLRSERPTWTRTVVPAELGGKDRTFVTDLAFDRKLLPHGVLDRRILFCLVHPSLGRESIALLPLPMWWRQDLDAFTQQLGLLDEDRQQAAQERA